MALLWKLHVAATSVTEIICIFAVIFMVLVAENVCLHGILLALLL
jgi:hypothetical protein